MATHSTWYINDMQKGTIGRCASCFVIALPSPYCSYYAMHAMFLLIGQDVERLMGMHATEYLPYLSTALANWQRQDRGGTFFFSPRLGLKKSIFAASRPTYIQTVIDNNNK